MLQSRHPEQHEAAAAARFELIRLRAEEQRLKDEASEGVAQPAEAKRPVGRPRKPLQQGEQINILWDLSVCHRLPGNIVGP